MLGVVLKLVKWSLGLLALVAVVFLGVRIWSSQRGLPLDVWHTYAPDEMTVAELEKADWSDFLRREDEIFVALRENVTRKLGPDEQVPFNRYFENSPLYPEKFSQNWNRSYALQPAGAPAGAAVLLHGLTDSPYSLRHVAARYRERGYFVVAIRLPAHGTVPAALTKVDWSSWMAATRLAVREARRRAPAPLPLHIVGFSNGGTLALKYALEAIENKDLARPDRLILISPMVGVTSLARFAGFAGLPAILPAFAKAAWLSVMPEFNPFKYNSFPVNGARQSYRLTDSVRSQMAAVRGAGRLSELPPIITFQSVMDFTVSTQAVLSGLYDQLPSNGSELVLFDVNRNVKFGPLLRSAADAKLSTIVPPGVRNYRLAVVTNAGEATDEAVERVVEAGATQERTTRLGLSYPKGVFSLSHVALPFPLTDSLYGLSPDETEDFGVHLGALAPRGERGTLIVSLDALLRMSSNPFFSYLIDRIDERIVPTAAKEAPKSIGSQPAPEERKTVVPAAKASRRSR